MITWLDGRKTYIAAIATAVYTVLIAFEIVPSSETVWALIAAFAIVGFRGALAKISVKP